MCSQVFSLTVPGECFLAALHNAAAHATPLDPALSCSAARTTFCWILASPTLPACCSWSRCRLSFQGSPGRARHQNLVLQSPDPVAMTWPAGCQPRQ